MKRFTFRLARLEKLRSRRKKEARSVLAVAINKVRDAENIQLACRREYEDSFEAELPDSMAEDPRAIEMMVAWRDGLKRKQAVAGRQLQEAESIVSEKQKFYTEAARANRVLEILRERQYKRWQEETNREEQKFLDEVHLLRLGRRRSRLED